MENGDYTMSYFFSVIFFILLSFNVLAQEKDIWGIWNVRNKEYATSTVALSTGTYLFDSDDGARLTFYEDYYNNGPRISYQGGHYKVDKIISINNSKAELYISYEQTFLNEDKKYEKANLLGKLIIHFIDENKMWLELDYGDKEYPTDVRFTEADFKGKKVIYWREKIKILQSEK